MWGSRARFVLLPSGAAVVAALAFACSQDTVPQSGFDAGSADGGDVAFDSGNPPSRPDPSSNCMTGFPSVTPSSSWVAPSAAANTCTAGDVTAFTAALQNPQATFTEIQSALSAPCVACIFTASEKEPTWSLFVGEGQGSYIVNQGACYADAIGGSAACGDAMYRETQCFQDVCNMGCPTCAQYAFGQNGPCAEFADAVKTACGANAKSLDDQCVGPMPLDDSRVVFQMKLLCANPNADAGADDAGPDVDAADDAGDAG